MEVLLLSDIPGIGKRSDVIVVRNGYALNNLLPMRLAIVVTPSVRKRYAEQIKERAIQRDRERTTNAAAAEALRGKSIEIKQKAGKTGKLYAAVSEQTIADAIAAQMSIGVKPNAISPQEPIKSTGAHQVTIKLGDQSLTITVVIVGEEK